MFRNIINKTTYKEFKILSKGAVIMFDPQPIMVTDYDEDGNPISTHEDPTFMSVMQENFKFVPDIHQIKRLVIGHYNTETDRKILNGFSWTSPDGTVIDVYLSSENQFNYKAAYDLAYQTNGQSLPFTLKFGDAEDPQYYDFSTLEVFEDFYTSCIGFINSTLKEGWVKKDSMDWSKYQIQN